MSKITLTEANEIVDQIELVDAFASIINSTIAEDVLKLSTYKDLSHKIFLAEMESGILDIKNQIKLLEKEEKYYNPVHSVFYYKEIISEHHKENINQYYDTVISDISFLNKKIRLKEEKIYIRTD